MAVLEEEGYIEKMHSSSGRIPSMKGYRFYLDHLVEPTAATPRDYEVIQKSFQQHYHKLDEIVDQSAKILSDLTSYTAITLGPEVKDTTLTGFRLVPLGDYRVMAILVTSAGTVESQVFSIPQSLTSEELEKAIRIVNDNLVGLPLTEVASRLKDGVPQVLMQYMTSPSGFLDIFEDVLKQAAQEHYYVGGRLNLLNYLADKKDEDIDQLKSVYEMIDQSDSLANLLNVSTQDQLPNSSIRVRLGDEMSDSLKNFSLITANYDLGEHGQGMVALLGPTSMPYSRMIGLLDVFREELAKRLTDYYFHYPNH
ncbi:hypothetical protein IV38_GL000483 [Lactobacillus selangorensis]|nr:hypothetical protein IV38_GL000483 [Lactobacillus selangorensis]